MRRVWLLAAALAGCGTQAMPNVRSADPYERYLGGVAVGEHGDPADVRLLDRLMADPHPLARDGGVLGMSLSGAPDAAARIARVLDASDPSNTPMVRSGACRVLGELGGDEARDALLKALGSDPSHDVRRTAVHALTRWGNEAAVRDALIAALADPRTGVAHAAWESLMDATGRRDLPRSMAAWREAFKTQP